MGRTRHTRKRHTRRKRKKKRTRRRRRSRHKRKRTRHRRRPRRGGAIAGSGTTSLGQVFGGGRVCKSGGKTPLMVSDIPPGPGFKKYAQKDKK